MDKIVLHLRKMYTKSLIPPSSTPVVFVLYCSYWCYSLSADNELGVLHKGHGPVAVHWAETEQP